MLKLCKDKSKLLRLSERISGEKGDRLIMARISSSKSRVSSSANKNKEEMPVSVRIASAIRDKSCPICLRCIDHYNHKVAVLTVCMHAYCIDCIRKWSELKRNCPLCKTEFDSWFFKTRFSNGKFKEERLRKLDERKRVDFGDYRSERGLVSTQRTLDRSRVELFNSNRRSRPLPWRRSFGQRQRYEDEVVRERVLGWRASIYNQRLQAIPLLSRNCKEQITLGNYYIKEIKQRRVEPWIRRELQAILGDLDLTVIVHLATSLYISSLEEKREDPSNRLPAEDKLVEPLRPFLHDRTEMFWHELRCFGESSLTMEVYDCVVDYRKWDKMQNGE
ncbi:zinc finger protein [Macleaya cordata]|uniref:RING-type E3 ubiquitin transferase n=1 Tax=Macleaya cordata TaxID=56857 RepID=A0A200QX23_MACCD|nr:zinc finger protein [Macleaya cordata]